MKLGILGCGNWGSVFGILQYRNQHSVKIWEYNEKRADYVNRTRNNEPFLVGYKIPDGIKIHWNMEAIIKDVDCIVFALPSQVLYDVVEKLKKKKKKHKYYLSLVKGIDIKSLMRPSEIINQLAQPEERTYVLSGPCIANELIRDHPTAVVLVGPKITGARELQQQLATESLRIYQSNDIVGVELGAAIKNVIALACGISDGLGFGNNTKGALIARGIVEIQRLGRKMGAKEKTFWGLSGLGDLVTTSFSEESRNHTFGKKLGEGFNVQQIKKEMVMVAEGFPTSRAIKSLTEKYNVEMPICNLVFEILFKNKQPKQAIRELMTRPLKNE